MRRIDRLADGPYPTEDGRPTVLVQRDESLRKRVERR